MQFCQQAAEALAALFQGGHISPKQRQTILVQRAVLSKTHEDKTWASKMYLDFTDHERCKHVDRGPRLCHQDTGPTIRL